MTNCQLISIHAPTRGATQPERWGDIRQRISIHAPTRGATGKEWWLTPPGRFQSTLPQGERPEGRRGGIRTRKGFQSTLPKGERPSVSLILLNHAYFNPRSHKGSDSGREFHCGSDIYFNPRSHKGSDVLSNGKSSQDINFNPRSHKGSD